MINKELLSRILNGEVKYFNIDKNLVYYDIDYGTYINIYELSNKCKKWIVDNSGYYLNSYVNEYFEGICEVKTKGGRILHSVVKSNEPNAVFDATEWIIKERLLWT